MPRVGPLDNLLAQMTPAPDRRSAMFESVFEAIHGTSVVMLGGEKAVLVAADKRMGNTLSRSVSDDAAKILPIHPNGLVTGWGLVRLQDDDTGEVRVDIFRMLRQLCCTARFQFRLEEFQAVGREWQLMMSGHLSRCRGSEWPETPECGFWFKALFVFRGKPQVEAWIVTFEYSKTLSEPNVGGRIEQVADLYVNGGHLLMEGDQRGSEYIESPDGKALLLPETHAAWTVGINPASVGVDQTARILKDALYANHLRSMKPDGEMGVGVTCDIALIDRQVGFRWREQNVSTIPAGHLTGRGSARL